MDPKTSRGFRNNNPTNLDKSSNVPYQGLADLQNDPRFYQFKTAKYGIRAACRNLTTYYDKHNIKTVEGIVGRWAPRSENDTKAYVKRITDLTTYAFDQELDLHDPTVMFKVVKAIINVECGGCPYTDAQINEGVYAAIGQAAAGATPRVSTGTKAAGSAVLIATVATQAAPYIPIGQSLLEKAPGWAAGSVLVLAVAVGIAYLVRREYSQNKAKEA